DSTACTIIPALFSCLHVSLANPLAYFCCTLSLHDALPISEFALGAKRVDVRFARDFERRLAAQRVDGRVRHSVAQDDYIFSVCQDRKSTRLNSSHVSISYAVFCLKKKN